MKTEVFELQNEDRLDNVVNRVISILLERQNKNNEPNNESNGSSSVVIALQGDLGAGKTTFTKKIAQKLGITETITSPTFVIQKRYNLKPAQSAGSGMDADMSTTLGFDNLIHIDAYRLSNSEDLLKINFNAILNSVEKNLICIEWPEIVSDIIPQSNISIHFEHLEGGMRKVTLVSNV